jgi:hypothetical protein
MPPGSTDYFVEFLNVPGTEQDAPKVWVPVELNDGWYGLPSFKFMGLMVHFLRTSDDGLEYAAPEMMALSNLLSHPAVTDEPIQSDEFRGLRRCAKDLGRVFTLAYLAGRDETDNWSERWRIGLQRSFPASWQHHGARVGNGLRELLAHDRAMEEARKTTAAGLLSGLNVGAEALRAVAEQLLVDAIEPMETSARAID